jgi:hypothetical protein
MNIEKAKKIIEMAYAGEIECSEIPSHTPMYGKWDGIGDDIFVLGDRYLVGQSEGNSTRTMVRL